MPRFLPLALCLPTLALAACSPSDPPPAVPQVQLAVHPDVSAATVAVDPSYPDRLVLVDAQIAVGLDNADPTAELTDTVTLTRLALVAGDTSVELADAAFHDATVKGRDAADMEYVYDATATNGAVATLCGAPGVVLRAEVRGATFGSATGDIPATKPATR